MTWNVVAVLNEICWRCVNRVSINVNYSSTVKYCQVFKNSLPILMVSLMIVHHMRLLNRWHIHMKRWWCLLMLLWNVRHMMCRGLWWYLIPNGWRMWRISHLLRHFCKNQVKQPQYLKWVKLHYLIIWLLE